MSTKTNYPTCKRCGFKYSARVRRPLWFKILLFWLPVKRFYCVTCERKAYVWWGSEE